MKNRKTLLSIMCIAVICVLFLWMNLSKDVHAAYRIDVTKPVSIKVTYKIGQDKIPDVTFSLYRVADISDHGILTITKDFQRYNINFDELDEEAFQKLAENLAAYVKRDKIPVIDQGKTNLDGILQFPTGEKQLYAGVYLIVGEDHIINGQLYDAQPMFLHLPTYLGNNKFLYDVEISPKYRLKEKTTEIKVVKVWDDKNSKYRPSSIEVQLIDGATDTVKDTVVLSKKNNWRYTWKELPFGDWEVIEKEVPQYYSVTIERDGKMIVLTNTSTKKPPEDPKEPEDPKDPETPAEPEQPVKKLPQTGTYWWPVPILAVLGCLCIAVGLVRRRYEE